MKRRTILTIFLSLFVSIISSTISAAPYPVVPVGTQFALRTDSSSIPGIARDADGNYVLVWEIYLYPNDREIYSQRFDMDDNPIGSAFRVNSYTTGKQWKPDVDVNSSGEFVVVWQSSDQDGSQEGVYGQRYNFNGVAQGAEFQVSTYTSLNQNAPKVTMLQDGAFVITWSSYQQDGDNFGVYARQFNASGQSTGNEVQINQYTVSSQTAPVITSNSNGDIVIVWESFNQGGQWYDIYARLYNSTLDPKGNEFLVNTNTAQYQVFPAVAMNESGNFVVAWSSGYSNFGDDIYAQRFDATGAALGAEIAVNSYRLNDQNQVDIAMNDTGDFLITWESWLQDGSGEGIFAKQYNSEGLSYDGEIAVNTVTTGSQFSSAVMTGSLQDFLIVWTGSYVSGTDAQQGIHGQRLGIDFDDDGFASRFDNCPLIANPIQLDNDNDDVGNSCDNCTEKSNTDQRDSNNDGYGNLCDQDLNNDGITNYIDLGIFKSNFYSTTYPDGDFNNDGIINFIDFGVLKANFFQEPGPSGLVP